MLIGGRTPFHMVIPKMRVLKSEVRILRLKIGQNVTNCWKKACFCVFLFRQNLQKPNKTTKKLNKRPQSPKYLRCSKIALS